MLIGPLDVPWITDFGLSASTNASSVTMSSQASHANFGGKGTLRFRCPESYAFPPQAPTPAADVYSFAVLMWIVIIGEARASRASTSTFAIPLLPPPPQPSSPLSRLPSPMRPSGAVSGPPYA